MSNIQADIYSDFQHVKRFLLCSRELVIFAVVFQHSVYSQVHQAGRLFIILVALSRRFCCSYKHFNQQYYVSEGRQSGSKFKNFFPLMLPMDLFIFALEMCKTNNAKRISSICLHRSVPQLPPYGHSGAAYSEKLGNTFWRKNVRASSYPTFQH